MNQLLYQMMLLHYLSLAEHICYRGHQLPGGRCYQLLPKMKACLGYMLYSFWLPSENDPCAVAHLIDKSTCLHSNSACLTV